VGPGSDSETLLDLLVQWEELRAQGKEARPEELCPDDADLQARLRERLARRQRLEAAMELPAAARREPVPVAAMLPVIDGYEIGELLGRGGMGLVFRAEHKGLKRPVALKIILSGAHAGTEERARFRTEAEAVARLHHAGIVQIYDVGEQAGCPYLALEFVGGGSLAEQLHGTPMAPRRAAELIRDLAEAVQHAHEQGIVHRDLKPGNVLLSDSGVAKITDFGLAKLVDAERGHTRTGAVLGSPSYMAPEQAAGKARIIGPAADIYALGAILYELLTGRPPFLGASFLDTLDLVRSHEPAPPHALQPNVPLDLATICLKCLRKEPGKRYLSAVALAEDLGRFLSGRPVRARPVSRGERLWRWCRREPAQAALLASGIFAALVLAVGTPLAAFWWRQQRNDARLNEQRAQVAEQDVRNTLWDSYLSQVELGRLSKQVGQRFQGLEVLKSAAQIRRSPAVRNAAIGCLALADLKVIRQWPWPMSSDLLAGFDAKLERYAYKDDARFRIIIRRVADDRVLLELPAPGVRAWISKLRFSPDGRHLGIVYTFLDDSPPQAFVWDLTRQACLLEGVRAGSDSGLEFSPDSGRVALVRSDGSISIYTLPGGQEQRRLEKSCRASSVAFEPSGRRLAVSSWEERLVEIRDLARDGQVDARFVHRGNVYVSAWRGDGKLLATACNDKNAYLWDVSTQRQLAALTGHLASVPNVTFNHTGNMLATASWDGTTKLWDAVTGANLLTAQGYCLNFSQDDAHLSYLTGPELGIWQVGGSRECRALDCGRVVGPGEEDNGPWSLDFSSDGRLLAAAGSDGVRLWEMPSGRQVEHLATGASGFASFAPGGTSLITYGQPGLQRWPIRRDQATTRIGPLVLQAPTNARLCKASMSESGDTIAYLDIANEQTVIIDAQVASKKVVLKGLAREIDVAMSPDGRWVAVGNFRTQTTGARVWDVRTGTQVWQLPHTDQWSETCMVRFSPDGQWLVTAEQDKFRLWRVGTWAPGPVIRRDRLESGVGPTAFSRDSRLLALAQATSIVALVEPATGREIARLSVPDPQFVTALCFGPNADLLAVAMNNRVVRVWDLRSIRQQLRQMNIDWDLAPDRD
jgi:WD40 repeat protein/predicted Ser/Thr protein kinase